LHPLIGILPVDGELGDGKEKAPDKYVFLATGDLDQDWLIVTFRIFLHLTPE
jgi:hypothetical protein